MLVVGGVLLLALPASAVATGTVLVNATTPVTTIPGATVTISGSGFTADTTYTITATNTVSGAVTTLASGIAAGTPATGFTASIIVPSLPRGSYTITAAGITPVNTTGTPATMTITPSVPVLSPTILQAGGQMYVSDRGLTPSVNVTIWVDSSFNIGTFPTDITGSITNVIITVPSTITEGANNHYVYVYDSGAGTAAYFALTAKMNVSTTSTVSGAPITATGTFFTAGDTLNFYLDSSYTPITSVIADSNGAFSTSIAIPATFGGNHTLKVQDASNISSTDSANFTVTSKASIAPATDPAGTSVTVTGSGYGQSVPVTITYSGAAVTTVPSSVTSDTNGNITATFKTPTGPSNANTVTISDGTYTNTATFTSIATGSITTTKGNTGTAVQVTGAGFIASHAITITYNNTNAGSATSDVNGNFTANINVPNAPASDHTMTLSDGTNSISQTFTITPNATMSPLTGFVGTNITVQGTGFTALRGVSVKYDGTDTISPAPTSDANGTFAASFKAPVSKGGNHTVIITDGNNTMTFTFAVDATPPTVPAPQLPISNTQADAIPSLKWSDVTSQNLPLTYRLQLSDDAAFAHLIVDQSGLTVSSYTLTAAQSLPNRSKQAPYYWRVQAIDGASNVSAWSAPSTFFVGFVLPSWALYVIFAVVAIILGVLGFWLGKRRAMSM